MNPFYLMMLAILWLCPPVPVAGAERAYVSDTMQITLRGGEGTQFKILRMLESGEPLEVLSSNPESGYSRVRTTDGATGWVLDRYLQNQPIAADRLQQVSAELARLRNDLRSQQQTITENAAMESTIESLQQELATIRQTAAAALQTKRERDQLQHQLQQLREENHLLQRENDRLRTNRDRHWFIAGAGVLLGGMLLGLVIPRIRWRRRRDDFFR